MARALQNPTVIVIIGDATGPALCISDYVVENADMREPTKLHEDSSPDFTVTTSEVVEHCITDIKTTEGL